jgi:Ala-tRNA(Pro) deacylase
MMADMDVFDRLVDLFRAGEARFRVIEHPAEGRSDAIAAIRGTQPSQGAKAIVCAIPVDGDTRFVLAVVPGDRRVTSGRWQSSWADGRAASPRPPSLRR